MDKVFFVALNVVVSAVVSLALLPGCSSLLPSSFTSNCQNIARAVIDLGSGSTKMTLAEVEKCETKEGPSSRIIKILDDKTGEALALEAGKNSRGEIPVELQDKAIDLLGRLQDKAKLMAAQKGYKSLEVAVVGTHAFRTAGNILEFKNRITAKGFYVLPLTQTEEAITGVKAVTSMPVAGLCSPLLVWDVGGGSAQFSFMQNADSTTVGIPVGAESFKKTLAKAQRSKGPDRLIKPKSSCSAALSPDKNSPNPIGLKNFAKAMKISRAHADEQMEQLPIRTSCAVGIGGVHRKAVAEQIEKNWKSISSCVCKDAQKCELDNSRYTRIELQCLAEFFVEKSDCDQEIKGPYSDTSVSNLLMVLAFMDKLGIDRVYTASVNMGHALVLDDGRLNFRSVSTTVPTAQSPQE